MNCFGTERKIAWFCGLKHTLIDQTKTKLRLEAKVKNLSERQDRSLKEQTFDSIRNLDGISLPKCAKDLLSHRPKQPIGEKFN